MSDEGIDGSHGPHVRIRLDGNGRGITEINGVDLSSVVHSTKLTTKAGQPSYLELGIWCELLELEGPVEQVLKLIESAEAAADAKVIGVTEHGDLVHAAPDDGKALAETVLPRVDGKALAETVARNLPDVLAKKGLT